MVFAFMKMLGIQNMAMKIITVYNVVYILNGIKPQKYPQKKQGSNSPYSDFCFHKRRQR